MIWLLIYINIIHSIISQTENITASIKFNQHPPNLTKHAINKTKTIETFKSDTYKNGPILAPVIIIAHKPYKLVPYLCVRP